MTKTVLYSCPFVPAEWIAAHGFAPSRIMPRSTKGGSSVEVTFGVCTYARAFVAAALADTAAAVVVTTVCDQMRRASELIARSGSAPAFLMNVPSTWETASARQLYRDELERLGRFLVGLGGHSPSQDALTGVMLANDGRRATVRAAREWLSPKAYAQAIVAFHQEGVLPSERVAVQSVANGIPVALLGGPMLREDLAVFDLVEEAGGRIVLDGTETGERTLPAPLNRRQAERDPLGELTRAYFDSIPDVSRRPNHGLFREVVADRLDTTLDALGDLAARAREPAVISSMCVVFAETEIIGLLAGGTKPRDIVAGVQASIASRIRAMIGRRLDPPIVLTGGVAMVPGMAAALEAVLEQPITIAPRPQMTGALGAGLVAARDADESAERT